MPCNPSYGHGVVGPLKSSISNIHSVPLQHGAFLPDPHPGGKVMSMGVRGVGKSKSECGWAQ